MHISAGQHSETGAKPVNQDFHGLVVPDGAQLTAKGIALAIADGISSSTVSQVASAAAVKSLLDDYYCTSDAWSVRTSVERVLRATNSWLHAQTQKSDRRFDRDHGYVCTLSALVLKGGTAHLFHVGDARIHRLRASDSSLELLTTDHRVRVSDAQSYLGRALGIDTQLEIDYQALPLGIGDVFILTTDGVHEHVETAFMRDVVRAHSDDLDTAARQLAQQALANGSLDNITVQIVRIEQLAAAGVDELHQQSQHLACPPPLQARMLFEGFRIERELHASNRSHVYLATDVQTDQLVALKTPSIELAADPASLERFLLEEWVARRIDSAHVLKAHAPATKRDMVYVATEYIEGHTLAQWMLDHPRPALATVRGIVEQIARGLYAFHRLEMLHQDLRPHNIMIEARTGCVKIIDFGSTRVAGIAESVVHPGERAASAVAPEAILGTEQYTAPEYFLGENGTPQSDLFSLGVITYQMLTGRLPYGTAVCNARTRAAQRQLRYVTALADDRDIPAWIDAVLERMLEPDPRQRYQELSEFTFDLRQPSAQFLNRQTRLPLIERDPRRFWQTVSLVLAVIALLLLWDRF